MEKEIRFRAPVALHAKIVTAARTLGVPISSLVSVAVYEYLRDRTEPKQD